MSADDNDKCKECRFHAMSKVKQKLECMLSQETQPCKLFAKEVDWNTIKNRTGPQAPWSRKSVEKREAEGVPTELQVMRLGVARFNVATAAATLDRMSKQGLSPKAKREAQKTINQFIVLEDILYEEQRHNHHLLNRNTNA